MSQNILVAAWLIFIGVFTFIFSMNTYSIIKTRKMVEFIFNDRKTRIKINQHVSLNKKRESNGRFRKVIR